MKIVVIIQARMGSTRLPGKVMIELCGKTVLAHIISRIQTCKLIDEIVIATTTNLIDDVIAQEAKRHGTKCFRGSEENVLERYYLAAKEYKADIIVRITSDCPLLDPELLSEMLTFYKSITDKGGAIDYLSNTITRTYPLGLDIEIFTFTTLEKAFVKANKSYEIEHVTPYIEGHPEIFSLQNYKGSEDLSGYRLTLDTEDDLKLISEVYDFLYKKDEDYFTRDKVIAFLKNKPDLVKLNAHVKQKTIED